MKSEMWDYLILTAGNDTQAAAYRKLLGLRNRLGLIPDVKNILVVPDTKGKRIGSGGSTLLCLLAVLNHQEQSGQKKPGGYQARYGASVFSNLRILIIHAGGDSKRVPAYGSCGKIFVPIPGESDQALPLSIFDRLLPTYLTLPPHAGGKGQVVVASGDVLLFFDAEKVHFDHGGITGLGCEAAPETAKNHGVICADPGGRVRTYLQKPSVDEQSEKGAIDHAGQSVLDIGVFSFDGPTAARLVELCGAGRAGSGKWIWNGAFGRDIEKSGLDFYREITSAMGRETAWPDYSKSVRRAGSRLSMESLRRIYRSLRKIPFFLSLLPRCDFLHFGTSRQLIAGGNELLAGNRRMARHPAGLDINNAISANGRIIGSDSWIEGCRVRASLTLGGENVVAGVDVETPVSLPPGTVLDVLKGKAQNGGDAWFVRCYGIDDGIRQTEDRGALFLNRPVEEWLKLMGARAEDVWPAGIGPKDREIWNGRFFPAVTRPGNYEKWLWMLEPENASDAQKKAWRSAPRSSFEETARRASLDDFHARRLENRAEEISGNVPRLFDPRSEFSADELVHVLLHLRPEKRALWPAVIIKEAHRQSGKKFRSPGMENLAVSRILHSLGSAVQSLDGRKGFRVRELLRGAEAGLSAEEKAWLGSLKMPALSSGSPAAWARAARDAAFENVGRTIVLSSAPDEDHPRSALRSDEIIWGRAPARLDLGGGWSDTPPYSLEHGGCVINAAVDLNGQPPIQVYARVTGDPTIKVYSIDHGAGITIRTLEDLLDYRKPTSQFGLAKAALALSGFSLETAAWPRGTRTLKDMLKRYGGGIELTTLAAIPSGSGLGTSSIMGAALTAVVHRMMGRTLSPRELFHRVLQLEQELTTGGGWQDQIGGVLPGVKVITADPGLIPNPRIHYITPDVLDPGVNKGQTLLYYTGLRRLAKNILRNVVGKYLDRDRRAMRTLRALHAFPPLMSEAMAGKDMKRFGELIERAWNLNKQIDPDSTTDIIESVLKKIGPLMHGAKLLGAGGGGFLLIVAKSPVDAQEIRGRLESDPPNERARFFEYDISGKGLSVTVC